MTIQHIIDNSKLISTYIAKPDNNNVTAHYLFKSGEHNIKMSLCVEYDAKAGTIDILNTNYDITPDVDGFRDAMCSLGGKLMNHVDIDAIFEVFE